VLSKEQWDEGLLLANPAADTKRITAASIEQDERKRELPSDLVQVVNGISWI
jgi:hypothetical protein